MNFEERYGLLRRILLGKFYAWVKTDTGKIKFKFIDPPQELLLEADFVYNDALKSSGSVGMLAQEQAEEMLIEEGKWSQDMAIELGTIKSDIEKMQKQLPSLKYHKTTFRRTTEMIKVAKNRLEELSDIKNQYFELTTEGFAQRKKRDFILKHIAEPFDSGLKYDFSRKGLNALDVCYYRENEITVSSIRKLVRTDPWRIYWSAAKNTGSSLFHGPLAEMTDLQYALLLWTRVYDYAYECTNPPPDDVIDNDEAFDAWYNQEADKNKREKAKNTSGITYGSGYSEKYIPADIEGAREVYNLNDPSTRGKIKKRQDMIKEKGEVKEAELPDIQAELKMQANRMSSDAIQKRGK